LLIVIEEMEEDEVVSAPTDWMCSTQDAEAWAANLLVESLAETVQLEQDVQPCAVAAAPTAATTPELFHVLRYNGRDWDQAKIDLAEILKAGGGGVGHCFCRDEELTPANVEKLWERGYSVIEGSGFNFQGTYYGVGGGRNVHITISYVVDGSSTMGE
jgi:hypothetical protein